MTSTEAHPSVTLARALVAALADLGVRDAVLCPGSRDAPLLYAFADLEESARVRLHVRLDERSAGFMALGLGKASILAGHPRPAAVVCTSGTAVANLHPAALEADAAGIPLLVITANRPEQLWHTGANQTTTQPGIFGAAMRFQTHIPSSFPPDSHLRGLTQRLVAAALGTFSHDPGPVHLDVSFDDPLVPDFAGNSADHSDVRRADGDDFSSDAPEDGGNDEAQHLNSSGRTHELACPARSVVVAGDLAGGEAEEFARAGGWPLLAEPSSGSRFGPNALTHYQQILNDTDLAKQVEHVVVFGHPTLSRPVSKLLRSPKPAVTVVATTPRWTDVAGNAQVVPAPVQAHVFPDADTNPHQPTWLELWLDTDRSIDKHQGVLPSETAADDSKSGRTTKDLGKSSAQTEQPGQPDTTLPEKSSEPVVAPGEMKEPTPSISDTSATKTSDKLPTNPARAKDAVCAKLWEASCPEEGKRNVPALMMGASDVIRSFDRFAVPRAQPPVAASNRGLAGIDGTVSTALGLQAGLGRPVRVVLGDLAALHDLTGLLHGSLEAEPDVQVVVLNDHGGAIFAGLEHAQAPRETLERFFLTPQDADFRALAHAAGWKYAPVDLRDPEPDQAGPGFADEAAEQTAFSAVEQAHEPSALAPTPAAPAQDVAEQELPGQASSPASQPSADISGPQSTGLDLLADLLSHPIRGRSLIEVRLPAV